MLFFCFFLRNKQNVCFHYKLNHQISNHQSIMVSLFLVSRFQTNYTVLSEHCISHICCVRKTKIMRANPFKGLHMTDKKIWSAQKLVGLKSSIKSIIKLKFGLFSAAFSLLPFHLYFHHVLLYFCHVLLWTTVKPCAKKTCFYYKNSTLMEYSVIKSATFSCNLL